MRSLIWDGRLPRGSLAFAGTYVAHLLVASDVGVSEREVVLQVRTLESRGDVVRRRPRPARGLRPDVRSTAVLPAASELTMLYGGALASGALAGHIAHLQSGLHAYLAVVVAGTVG